jgi:7-cyano-7-deazaguanine reductase
MSAKKSETPQPPSITVSAQDRLARRAHLITDINPETATDYLVTLHGDAVTADASVRLFYVPDKYVLQPDGFSDYLSTLSQHAWENLESLALAILDDINNEVVPRWVQIVVQRSNEQAEHGHRVLVEDRQPNWDNPPLLDRLRQW